MLLWSVECGGMGEVDIRWGRVGVRAGRGCRCCCGYKYGEGGRVVWR